LAAPETFRLLQVGQLVRDGGTIVAYRIPTHGGGRGALQEPLRVLDVGEGGIPLGNQLGLKSVEGGIVDLALKVAFHQAGNLTLCRLGKGRRFSQFRFKAFARTALGLAGFPHLLEENIRLLEQGHQPLPDHGL